MTERERLLEKIRKVQALANRGADGEKKSAAALLDKLMKQYGIDEAEIAEERLEKCFFRYKTPYERKLLVQVIYTVTGKIPFKCVGSYSGRARKQVGIDCTAAERLEIEFSYEFYKAALEEEMERFYSAFLMKNDIFPPDSKKAEEIPAAEISFTARAQPDFQGTLDGGRSIVFEAKYTTTDRLKWDVLTQEQRDTLERHARRGALAAVCGGIGNEFFFVPWTVWRDMKEHFGRKYVTAADLEQWRVRFNGAVLFLDYVHHERSGTP